MTERPLPRSPLDPPPADPLGAPKSAPPHAAPQIRLAEVTNEWLSVVSEQMTEQNRHLRRISGTLSAISILALVMLLLWLFGGLLMMGSQ